MSAALYAAPGAVERAQHAYVRAALWSTLDSDGCALSDRFTADEDEETGLPSELLLKLYGNVTRFLEHGAATGLLDDVELEPEQLGHSLLLSQNRHGSGLWDLGLDELLGERLHTLATSLGEVSLHVDDDGRLELLS